MSLNYLLADGKKSKRSQNEQKTKEANYLYTDALDVGDEITELE